MAWKPDYVTLTQLKDALRITDAADDTMLGYAISAASRAIDDYCGRQFGVLASPAARYYNSTYNKHLGRYVVAIDDLMTTTGLVVKTNDYDTDASFGNTLTLDTDYRLAPYNAVADGRPWTMLVGAPLLAPTHVGGPMLPLRVRSIEITATWGWTAVPAEVTQACLIQAARLFMRRNAPFGVAGSPDLGSEMRLLSRLDPDVELMVRPLRRVWGAV